MSGALNNNSTTNGAQTTTVAPVSNGDSTALSGSNSGAAANQNQAQFNGGNSVGAIDSSVRVGPTTSTSDSNSTSGSISGSVSEGGAGGSSTASGGAGGSSDASSSAQGGAGGVGTASSNQSQNAQNAGNQQNINFNSTTPRTQVVKSVPATYAPALTTTLTETCMGSTSAGGSGVGFGFSLGSTWNDKQCVRRLNAREMAQTLGDRDAARALMCQDVDVARAYQAIGQNCFTPTPQPQVLVQAPPPAPYAAPPEPPPVTMKPIPNPPHERGERG